MPNPELAEMLRRLQHMHAANSDSVQWYRNQIAQTLRRFNALPPKLTFEDDNG